MRMRNIGGSPIRLRHGYVEAHEARTILTSRRNDASSRIKHHHCKCELSVTFDRNTTRPAEYTGQRLEAHLFALHNRPVDDRILKGTHARRQSITEP
eukprot:2409133-Rhodomonas_salina.5